MSEIANPFSTGSGGATFEMRIQSSFLLQMLIKGSIPTLPYGNIDYIRLQARQAGIHTDDIVASITTPNLITHRMFGQIKHNISITERNDTFNKVIEEFWKDFNNTSVFNKELDRLVLITGPLTMKIIKHLRPLFDWARYSKNATEFLVKVETPNFSSKEKKEYITIFREVLNKINDNDISDEQLWRFFKCIFILGYDFDQQESVHYSQILTLIQLSRIENYDGTPESIWTQILDYVSLANQNAGTITFDQIPNKVKEWVRSDLQSKRDSSLRSLQNHSKIILDSIGDKINHRLHINRTELKQEITNNILHENNAVLISGVAGVGKSALAKDILLNNLTNVPSLVFKIEEFNQPHLDNVFSNIVVNETFTDWFSRFCLLPEKVILIEGLEKIFELQYQDTFKQFLNIINQDNSIKLIATCRIQSIDKLRTNIFYSFGIKPKTFIIPLLTDIELNEIKSEIGNLSYLLKQEKVKRLLRVPLYLNLACMVNWNHSSNEILNIRSFKDIIWRQIIERESETTQGLPIKRKTTFMNIAISRAKTMKMYVNINNNDPEATQKLLDDNIIILDPSGSRYAPAHDLFEDWALDKFISEHFENNQMDSIEFFEHLGFEPAIRRSFRIWLTDNIDENNNYSIDYFVSETVLNKNIQQFWRDEIITSLLFSKKSADFFEHQKHHLLENNALLFLRVLHILRVSCKIPNEKLINLISKSNKNLFDPIFLMPRGIGWIHAIKFIYNNIDCFQDKHIVLIQGVLTDWVKNLKYLSLDMDDGARECGLISLEFYRRLEKKYGNNELKKSLIEVMLQVADCIKDEFSTLISYVMNYEKETGEENNHDELYELSLGLLDSNKISKCMPELVMELAEHRWIKREKESDFRFYTSDNEMEDYFGLDKYNAPSIPASAFRTPILHLLRVSPWKTIDFIIKIIDYSTRKYINSDLAKGEDIREVTIKLNDGREVLQWGNERLWSQYRGTSSSPYLIQSLLMSLEYWLFELVEANIKKEYIVQIFNYILLKSHSVSTTAVLTSLAIAHSEVLDDALLPLFTSKELFSWDLSRSIQDQTHISDIRGLIGIPTGKDDFLYDERKNSDSMPHRKKHLENLILDLQFTSLKERVYTLIDQHHEVMKNENEKEQDKIWKLKLHRIDLRKYDKRKLDNKEKNEELLVFHPQPLEKDIEEFIQEDRYVINIHDKQMELMNWSMNMFENRKKLASLSWEEAADIANLLEENIKIFKTDSYLFNNVIDALCYFACVSIRDFRKKLDKQKIQWCKEKIIGKVTEEIGDLIHVDQVSNNTFNSSRPGVNILPLLVEETNTSSLKKLIFKSLIHSNDEIRKYSIKGIHEFLIEKDRAFVENCILGMIEFSFIYRKYNTKEYSEIETIDYIEKLCNEVIKEEALENRMEIDLSKMDQMQIVFALGLIPRDEKGAKKYSNVFREVLVSLLQIAKPQHNNRQLLNTRLNYNFIINFADLFCRFVLSHKNQQLELCRPLYEAVTYSPDTVAIFLSSFINVENQINSGSVFWDLWHKFSFEIYKGNSLTGKGGYEHEKLIKTYLFANCHWEEHVSEWLPLKGQKTFIKNSFMKFGHKPVGFHSLIKILYTIGKEFLPEAYIWMKDCIVQCESTDLLDYPNTLFYLEKIIQKSSNDILSIKKHEIIQASLLSILDELINHGSSTAFHIRDNIITPLPS